MIMNLPNHNKGAFERRVRDRMDHEGLDHTGYPYLWAQPYPRIPNMRAWLTQTIGEEHTGTWREWHGWIMFKHESDAAIMNLTWHHNTNHVLT